MEIAIEKDEVQHHIDKMCSLTWSDQVGYIIDNALMKDDHILGEYLILKYSIINGRSFKTDHIRYMYGYLKNLNRVQAYHLYYNSMDKDDLILAIKIDHPHLSELVNVHNQLLNSEIEVINDTIH